MNAKMLEMDKVPEVMKRPINPMRKVERVADIIIGKKT